MLGARTGSAGQSNDSLARLRATVAEYGSAAVAYSGGVDSTLVLRVATDVLGERAVGVTGLSPSLAPAEARDAERLASNFGARVRFVSTHELDDPDYVANGSDRCFHCKSELFGVCRRVADAEGLAWILDGTNADDGTEWRPGRQAGREAGVRSPLEECGLGKDDVRALARELGLPNWNKPALACLASRLPHGTPVTAEALAAVDRVEVVLRTLGFEQVRARHHGREVRLEVEPERVAELQALGTDPRLAAAIQAAGFASYCIAADGYRRGRLEPTPP